MRDIESSPLDMQHTFYPERPHHIPATSDLPVVSRERKYKRVATVAYVNAKITLSLLPTDRRLTRFAVFCLVVIISSECSYVFSGMSHPHKNARTLHEACAKRLIHFFRHILFQRCVIAPSVTLYERHWRFAGTSTGGKNCEEIAHPGTFDWIERDAGNRVGYGSANPLDDNLV